MDAKKSNKISEIVKLQQILKKWKKLSNSSKTNNNNNNNNNNGGGSVGNKGIKFLKKTLSFSENSTITLQSCSSSNNTEHVPKGYLAVCVGKELKRYVIPTDYLGHQAFGILLREAEEEFGFHQEGVLKIPCDVVVFERILKMVQEKRDHHDEFFFHEVGVFQYNATHDMDVISGSCSPDYDQLFQSSHPQLCR